MNYTVERQGQLDFVDYFKGGFAIVTAKGNPRASQRSPTCVEKPQSADPDSSG
jgi:hypothetical protein